MAIVLDGTSGIATPPTIITGANLGTTAGSQSTIAALQANNGNGEKLELTSTRQIAGSAWNGAGIRLQEKIDATWMGYIQFNGGQTNTNDGGISFGTGLSSTSAVSIIERVRITSAGNVGIGTTTPGTLLTVAGTITDNLGPVRAAPIQTKTGAYVVVAADAGTTIYITTGGVTINASILSAGDMITIVNNSASNQTITAGASVTFRLAGTAATGNRTLAQYGMATFLCVVGGATPTFHCSGAGLT